MDLAQLFQKYGSDKDSNGYSHLYSVLFDPIKHKQLNVLEIGIGTMLPGVQSSMKNYMPDTYLPGASLRAWQEFFPNSQIYGMDIQQDTQFSEERIKTYVCDSTDTASVKELMHRLNIKFDVIIDDGYHLDNAQRQTLENFFPYLNEGGIYVIEDIYVGSKFNSTGPHVVRDIIGSYEHFFVGLKNNQCVIRKNILRTNGFC